jgi:hypothetical protein
MDRIVFLLLVRLEPTQRRRRRRRLLWPWPVGRMASARSAAAAPHPITPQAPPWRPRAALREEAVIQSVVQSPRKNGYGVLGNLFWPHGKPAQPRMMHEACDKQL